MATEQEVLAIIIGPMRALYSPRRGLDNPDEAIVHYVRHLTRFDIATLKAGWDRVAKSYKLATWPHIGAIVEACEAAQVALAPKPDIYADVEKMTPPDHVLLASRNGQRALSLCLGIAYLAHWDQKKCEPDDRWWDDQLYYRDLSAGVRNDIAAASELKPGQRQVAAIYDERRAWEDRLYDKHFQRKTEAAE